MIVDIFSHLFCDPYNIFYFGGLRYIFFNKLVRKSELIQIERREKSRGMPRITLIEVIQNDMSIRKESESGTLDII